ncbi:MAG: glycosyltransferase [Hafnia sp.]
MKILFIITGLGMGGAERQVCDLADKYVQLGHQVLLVVLGGEVNNRPHEQSVKIINLDMEKKPLNFISAYFRAKKAIKSFEPDVVHSHMIHANIFSRLLRVTSRMPVLVNTAHSKNEGGYFRMLAYRLTDYLVDISTNVSKEAVDEFLAKGFSRSGKLIPMHNGIDHNKFVFSAKWRDEKRNELGIEKTTPLLLSVGRLTEAKDYPNLLKAFLMLNLTPKPQLVVIGAGELEVSLKQLAEELNCSERIHWVGMKEDVQEWYSACDLFVLSSRWEGFGLVVAEAMSCERPIVVTDAGGVAEVVGNSQLVVPVNNSDALAEKIVEVLNYQEDELKIILSNNRQRIVDNFSIEKIAEQWLQIYKA